MYRGNKIIGKVLSLISIANKEKIVIKKENFFFFNQICFQKFSKNNKFLK